MKATEEELASAVCLYLKDMGFEIYSEVGSYGGPVLDIVAKRGSLLWVVECKTTLNATVCAQAARSTWDANWVSVAVGERRRAGTSLVRSWLTDKLEEAGIGIIEATEPWFKEDGEWQVSELLAPRFRRRVSEQLMRNLHEAQKDYAPAGNAQGLRWSPFRQTCDLLGKYVRRHPGCSVSDAVTAIDHHYKTFTSAKQSLVKWARAGKIPAVRVEGRPPRLYPAECHKESHSPADRESRTARKLLMPGEGVEPSRPEGQGILSPVSDP